MLVTYIYGSIIFIMKCYLLPIANHIASFLDPVVDTKKKMLH
jgi:hypothetical protein